MVQSTIEAMADIPGVPCRFMHWAKTRSHLRYSLADSGVAQVTREEFAIDSGDLEWWAPGYYGYEPLLQAIAKHTGVPAECVVTATGTSMANHLAMAALLAPGDEVLIEKPAYEPLLSVARYLRAEVKRFERRFEDDYRLDVDALARSVTGRTRLIVLTNLHNPTGALIADSALRAVGAVARRAGARVLVDEVYLPAVSPAPGTALKLGPEFVVTSSLTKFYGLSGLRCGWILAEPELAQRIWLLNDLFGVVGPHPAERLSVVALGRIGEFEVRARGILAANRKVLDEFLTSRDDMEWCCSGFGSVLFPRLRWGSVERLDALLSERYESAVVPGSFFESPQHFRIGLGGRPAEFAEGMSRLGSALDALRA